MKRNVLKTVIAVLMCVTMMLMLSACDNTKETVKPTEKPSETPVETPVETPSAGTPEPLETVVLYCNCLVLNDLGKLEFAYEDNFQVTVSELVEYKPGYTENPKRKGLFIIDCTDTRNLATLIKEMSKEKKVIVFAYYDTIVLINCYTDDLKVEVMPTEYNPDMLQLCHLQEYYNDDTLTMDDGCAYWAFSADNIEYYMDYYGMEIDTVMLPEHMSLEAFVALLETICGAGNNV